MDDITTTLANLRTYKVQLEDAIRALENLARGRSAKTGRGTGQRTLAARQRMAEAQRKRWAEYRKKPSPAVGKSKPQPKTK